MRFKRDFDSDQSEKKADSHIVPSLATTIHLYIVDKFSTKRQKTVVNPDKILSLPKGKCVITFPRYGSPSDS